MSSPKCYVDASASKVMMLAGGGFGSLLSKPQEAGAVAGGKDEEQGGLWGAPGFEPRVSSLCSESKWG